MSAPRLIVLGVAAAAAIAALFLIRGLGARPAPSQAAAAVIAGEQVLVAAHEIHQGQALAAGDVTPRLFPKASVSANFMRAAQQSDVVGAVTRRPFAEGEPITIGSVVQPHDRGFLAAQLLPGYRAVAVKIESHTAAGDFIQPNDHVDVLLTSHVTMHDGNSSDQEVHSQTVLEDVRVLAIGASAQTQTSGDTPQQASGDVAVLELSSTDTRVLAQAEGMGDLSLALRGVEAEPPGLHAPSASHGLPALNERGASIRIHAFGTVSNGGGQ